MDEPAVKMQMRVFPVSAPSSISGGADAPLPAGAVALIAWLNGGEPPVDLGYVRDQFLEQARYRATLESKLLVAAHALHGIAERTCDAMDLPTTPGQEHARGFSAGVYVGAVEAAKLIHQAVNEAGLA